MYIRIKITQNDITISYEDEDPLYLVGLQIDQRPHQSAWEMIRPLLTQALDGLGLDLLGLDLSGVTSCHIWLGDFDDDCRPINLPHQWRLKLNMANSREIQGGLGVGPESQAFRESLVSYITHPDILGFNLEEGQYSPVRNNEDVKRLAREIHDALQARKEEQEKSQGDGTRLPENHY